MPYIRLLELPGQTLQLSCVSWPCKLWPYGEEAAPSQPYSTRYHELPSSKRKPSANASLATLGEAACACVSAPFRFRPLWRCDNPRDDGPEDLDRAQMAKL